MPPWIENPSNQVAIRTQFLTVSKLLPSAISFIGVEVALTVVPGLKAY